MKKLLAILMLCPSLALASGAVSQEGRKLKKEEEIYFYPTVGNAATGEIVLQGRVFAPELDSRKRIFFLSQLATWIGLNDEERNSPFLQERGLLFLVDSAEKTRVTISLPQGETWFLKSGHDGYFNSQVNISAINSNEQFLSFSSRPGDGRIFNGSAWMLAPEGISIISDIDDTVKITNVLNRHEMIRNTFVRPFQPVPGMAKLYRNLLANGGSLHFVSAGPQQLMAPLKDFADKNGFPPASFHMRLFHLDPQTIGEISSGAEEYKVETIRALIQRFPKRKFILVGDSGEKDPEAYARVLQEFHSQIIGVWIRDITNENRSSERYQSIYPEQAPLHIFHNPEELK